MLGLCCYEKFITTTKYYRGDNNEDNDRNSNGNDNENATTGSGSGGPIFDPITTPWSCLGIAEEDCAMAVTLLQPQPTIHLRVRLYIYPIKTIVKMCHKLLYEKIGGSDLCCRDMKNITS